MKKILSLLILFVTFAMASVSPLYAEDYKFGDLVISGIWARASAPGAKVGVVYMSITNNGEKMDMIDSASTPIAGKAMTHESKMVDDVMTMKHVGHIMIKPGGTIEMAPGGLHLMLMKLKKPLVDGEAFPLTILFKEAGSIDLMVPIRKNGF